MSAHGLTPANLARRKYQEKEMSMAAAAKNKRQNKGLGRGLDALLGDAPSVRAVKQREAEPGPKHELPIEFLRANADQPRRIFDQTAIEELAASIKSNGMLQPILVRPIGSDEYEIVAGERRWRAAQRAKLHNVPVIIRELTDQETAEIALIENVQRVDLNPAEEAAAYCRLADIHGRTQEEIAKAVGKSRSHVANTMRLVNLPQTALDALSTGAISAGHARALLGSSRPENAFAFVMDRGLSVRQTEAFIKDAEAQIDRGGLKASGKSTVKSKGSGVPSGVKKDSDTRALERDLSDILGLDVAIEHSKKGAQKGAGSISIDYQTLDQLDDLCRRLMGAGV